MSQSFTDKMRSVLKLSGSESRPFLQSLLTNNIDALTPTSPIYAALLTPQGKYLADFFLYEVGGAIFADVPSARAPAILQRLMMYKLRRDLMIETQPELHVFYAHEAVTDSVCCLHDPRHTQLGWRGLTQRTDLPAGDLTQEMIALGIPQDGTDLRPEDSYILEMGFERLNGVDFKKGCYVGQEIVARMHHKTTLKKCLVHLSFEAPLDDADLSVKADSKTVGRIGTHTPRSALALMKREAVDKDLRVGRFSAYVENVFSDNKT